MIQIQNKLINEKHIVSIVNKDLEVDTNIKTKEVKVFEEGNFLAALLKWNFKKKLETRYYDSWMWFHEYDLKTYIDNISNYVKDGIVYNNPHIVLRMVNGQSYWFWFDTNEEKDEIMKMLNEKLK